MLITKSFRVLALSSLLAAGVGACENKTRTGADLPDLLPAPVLKSARASRAEQQREELSQAATDLQAGFNEINKKTEPVGVGGSVGGMGGGGGDQVRRSGIPILPGVLLA